MLSLRAIQYVKFRVLGLRSNFERNVKRARLTDLKSELDLAGFCGRADSGATDDSLATGSGVCRALHFTYSRSGRPAIEPITFSTPRPDAGIQTCWPSPHCPI